MSDNDPTPESTDEPTTEPEPSPDQPDEGGTDWVAEARKWEKRAKENSDAAARLKDLEDAQKSEVDRLKDRITELEPSTKEAARLRVALRKGLTETQAKRLVGDTEEELEQDADELMATFAPASDDEPSPARRPQERLRPGATPSTEPEKSPEDLAADVVKARGY